MSGVRRIRLGDTRYRLKPLTREQKLLLNKAHYVPNRCFMFSFLGNYSYDFPQPIPLKKKLKDYLEDNVDEKYYINNEKADKLIKQLIDNGTLPQHNLDRQTDRQTDLR